MMRVLASIFGKSVMLGNTSAQDGHLFMLGLKHRIPAEGMSGQTAKFSIDYWLSAHHFSDEAAEEQVTQHIIHKIQCATMLQVMHVAHIHT